MSADDAIRATNDDATSCKWYAVQRGYWEDPYLQHFVRGASRERRAPEISRGYYARVLAVRRLLVKFLQKTDCRCQVINLGAGYDTLFWNLNDDGLRPTSFIEVDFHGVTSKKCHAIKNKGPLLEKITTEDGDIRYNRVDLHSAHYHLVAADLRNLAEVEQKLNDCDIDYTLPTIFLSECVLVYIDTSHSNALLSWIARRFASVFFVSYEQVNMTDRFGQVMIDNLRSRNCILNGVEHCASLETQKKRFESTGWAGADAWHMTTVYANLPQVDVQRIERIEMLDEQELLQQLFQHYCISWAYKDSLSISLETLSLSVT